MSVLTFNQLYPFLSGGSSGVFPPEKGKIRVAGLYFRDEENNIWQWRGATQFTLLYRYQIGEDISNQCNWLRANGFNLARVFPQFTDNFPIFQYPAPSIVKNFVQRLQKSGLRTELTFITFPDDESRQKDWVANCYYELRNEWNVFVEIYNEPEMHGYGNRNFLDGIDTHGIPTSYGYYVLDESVDNSFHTFIMPAQADYVTIHGDRGDEWPRKAKDVLEYRDGFADAFGMFRGCHCPIVNDEPIGAAEQDQPGRRSNVPSDFESYFGITTFFSAGGTYHFDKGLQGDIPDRGSKQQEIADRIKEVWQFIPRDLQTGNYGHPRELEDPIGALRVYQNGSYYVATRPTTGSLKDELSVKRSTQSGLIVQT